MGWLLNEERQSISASHQDYVLRAFVGPPREQVIHGHLQQDTPLEGVSAMTKLTAAVSETDTSIGVESTAAFPASGAFFIDTEFIEYGSKTTTTFDDLVRSDPASHSSGDIVRQFTEVTDYITQISLSGSIDQHEWTGSFSGVNYDHRLFQPDRSLYVEFRYYPVYGSPGPKVGQGFASTGVSVTELFTLKDGNGNVVYPHGMTWTRDGQLWVVTDDDQILRIDPNSGEVITTLTPSESITDMEGIASSPGTGDDFLWIASAHPATPRIYALDRFTGIVMTSWATTIQPTGIAWDGTYLWAIDLNALGIHKFDINGVQQWAVAGPDPVPGGIVYWDGALYVLGSGNRLYRVDKDTGDVVSIRDVPVVTNAQGFTIGSLGGRIGDATTGKIYELKLPATVGRTDDGGTGEWSGWLPLYFGYIEQGSIQVDYLEKTWSLTTRSTWMYFGDKTADGRNLAPSNIAKFRPVRVSSTLADPAVEISNGEYISVPGEGVDGGNIVDDDMSTVWISQDLPYMTEGADPTPQAVYGCMEYVDFIMSLRDDVPSGSTAVPVTDPNRWDHIPGSGGFWIDKGGANEEWVWYLRKKTVWVDNEVGGRTPLRSFQDLVVSLSDHTPKPIQNTHAAGTAVDGRIQCPETEDPCPKLVSTGRYCCDSASDNPNYVPYKDTGKQFRLYPGNTTADNLRRRLVFTEIYKPRLGLRPELAWWIEMRNIHDRSPANLRLDDKWSPWRSGESFLVMSWVDENGQSQSVNIPLSVLAERELVVGPWTDTSSTTRGRCDKGWLVVVANMAEFSRWWSVPSNQNVHVVELRSITDGFPDTSGTPIPLDFTHGELKLYYLNGPLPYTSDTDDPGHALRNSIGPTDTRIRVHNINKFSDRGFGMIVETDRRVYGERIALPYEWIAWTGREDDNGQPPGGGPVKGWLTSVTRGVEGTKAREWVGSQPFWRGSTFGFDYRIDGAVVVQFYSLVDDGLPLTDPGQPTITNPFRGSDGKLVSGSNTMTLSDWVKFGSSGISGYQRQLPVIKHGHSYARFSDEPWNWGWIEKKVPQPGEKLRTGRFEWFSVDLGEIDPPTLESADNGTSTAIGLTGDASQLLNSGVVLIDQELIKYASIDRDTSAVAPTVTAMLNGITRGYDGTSVAAHTEGTQVWQYVDRHALVEHLVSGISWHRRAGAPDGVPTHYRIYMTWRSIPRYPDMANPENDDWMADWELIWHVAGNTALNRGHFIQAFADVDSGVDATNPPGTLGYYEARHVMMVIDQTNSGRAKMNEFRVYGTNPRVNLLAGSLDREDQGDDDVNDMQNSIAVFFDYVIRGFGLSPDEVKIIGTGVNFYELPIASGPYTGILSELASKTGYRIWFNRFNQLWFTPDPASRRSMPVMTDLDATLMRGPIEIQSKPTGRVSQVIVYFRDDLADETVEVRYPEEPRGYGNPLKFDNVVVASGEEAKDIARQIYQEANGQWEIVAKFGIGHHFILGHRYTLTYSDWEGSDTYFQGASFIVSNIGMNITLGPERRWDTDVTLTEYHITV